MDWSNPDAKISKYFTVREALWLPSWNRAANPTDGLNLLVEANLEDLFTRMDRVRSYFGFPVVVHVAYRPEAYNTQIGGAKASQHVLGKAVDFHVERVTCDEVRARILPWLAPWGFRCENNPGSQWVHLDCKSCANEYRYFKP